MAGSIRLTFILVTTLLSTGGGVRYGGDDYALHMPAYGEDEPISPDSDDYRAHSPDYKYEEDFKSKTEKSLDEELNAASTWRRSARKQRKGFDDEFRQDDFDKFEPQGDSLNTNSISRFKKHRPRHKSYKYNQNDDDNQRFLKRTIRDRSDIPETPLENNLHLDKESFLDDSNSSDNDKLRFTYRTKSVRPRRRPRDRRERQRSPEEYESLRPRDEVDRPKPRFEDVREMEDIDMSRNMDVWQHMNKDKDPIDRRLLDIERPTRPRQLAPIRQVDPISGEDEPVLIRPHSGTSQDRQQYNNYNDYYNDDTKRAMDFKDKLPSMHRSQEPSKLVPGPLPRTSTELWANRRMLLDSTTKRSTTTRTITIITRTQASTTVFLPPTASTTTVMPNKTVNGSIELSLAEKSRLSILKKVHRKESGRNDSSTKKPPVLLQVTKRLPTVVMVEPPSSKKPWMRAAEVTEDTPQRLQKVRRLMRQKLLANARNIHDLTENWDDTVCDYVDMSLLDNKAHTCYYQSQRLSVMLLNIVYLTR